MVHRFMEAIMRTTRLKVTATVLAAAMAVGGTVGVLADTPTAGVTNYTSSVLLTDSLPTAGFSSDMMEVAIDCEETALIAATNPEAVQEEEQSAVASEYADMAVANVKDFVYIRKKPDKESAYVGKMRNDEVCTVLEAVDGWYHIKSGKCDGYIRADYLIVNDEEAVKKVSRRVATVNTNGLRVRKKASTNAKILGFVDKGDDLTVTDESVEGWVKVSIEEGEGYVSTDYVALSTEFEYAESKAEEKARLKKEAEEKKKAAEALKKSKKNKKDSSSSAGKGENKHYSAPDGEDGSAVARYAKQFVGNPYRYGGTSLTRGTDCSGFVMSVYKAFGVSLPHSSSSLRRKGYKVDGLSNAQPGDIVCYSGHVALYIGGGKIVHASNRRDGIKISKANYRRILAIRRIF